MKIFIKSFALLFSLFFLSPIYSYANCQGCCSYHGGVVCIDGVTKCGDGTTLSSICQAKGCNVCSLPTPTPTPTPDPVFPSSPTTLTENIRIASFNIQVFGVSKAEDPFVMDILARTIAAFDIVAIQEIRDDSGTAIIALENAVDSLGSDYGVIVGPRLGRTTSKEQYAFFYRVSMFHLGESYTYDDSLSDLFHREPFVASFSMVNGDFDFVLAAIHTDPDDATEEINSLPLVIEDAKDHFPGELDIILLGDFNADCSYFDENDMACLLRDESYAWMISNDIDTNVATSSCTYDRIVITDELDFESTKSAGVFRFDSVFSLTDADAKDVSDHYPVWIDFLVSVDSNAIDSSGDSSSSGGGGGGCFIETIFFGWPSQNLLFK